MRRVTSHSGRVGFGAAALMTAWALNGCVAATPVSTTRPSTARPTVTTTASLPTSAPAPSTPTEFTVEEIDRAFPSVTALTSTGEHLYWGSEAIIWQFTPGDANPQPVYKAEDDGALIWDVAAADAAFVFSELLESPAGAWRVAYVAGDGSGPVELDRGVAERGAPPTLAIDGRRISWAGFDESSGAPRSLLRVADRARPDAPTTLLDLDIDDGLLWYPQLDSDTLWYGIIEPDFPGTGAGDAVSVDTIDLADPSAAPARFDGHGNDFTPAVSADYVVWKSVEPGFAALTWGELYVLDRTSDERFVITDQADNPSIGSRFVAFEEISHQKLLLYDLATRTLVEVPDPMAGANSTVGTVAVAGNLLGFSVSAKGAKTVFWTVLPD